MPCSRADLGLTAPVFFLAEDSCDVMLQRQSAKGVLPTEGRGGGLFSGGDLPDSVVVDTVVSEGHSRWCSGKKKEKKGVAEYH